MTEIQGVVRIAGTGPNSQMDRVEIEDFRPTPFSRKRAKQVIWRLDRRHDLKCSEKDQITLIYEIAREIELARRDTRKQMQQRMELHRMKKGGSRSPGACARVMERRTGDDGLRRAVRCRLQRGHEGPHQELSEDER